MTQANIVKHPFTASCVGKQVHFSLMIWLSLLNKAVFSRQIITGDKDDICSTRTHLSCFSNEGEVVN